jgi:hypothetical protein
MALAKLKTEHAGAKNGGGHRGPRADAKRYSARRRRQQDRALEVIGYELAAVDRELVALDHVLARAQRVR